jgi:periplasmic mercuric ion binding protein
MKQLIIFGIFISSLSIQSQNSSIISSTLHVKGNCEMCKKRIENAADIKGVKFFEWSESSKTAKVIFDNRKTDLLTIEKAIASQGYDTPGIRADSLAYHKLPACCKYRSRECKEKN